MKRNSILSHVINLVNSMKTKLLHNLSNRIAKAPFSVCYLKLSVLLTIITGLVIYIVHCKHPPWAIPCHRLLGCGWRLAGRPWCRGPCCSAPGSPHPAPATSFSCCSSCYHQRGENSCTGHFALLPVWLETTQG